MIGLGRLNAQRWSVGSWVTPMTLVVVVALAALLSSTVAPGTALAAVLVAAVAAAIAAGPFLGRAAAERLILLYIFLTPLNFFILGDSPVSLERQSFGFRLSASDLVLPLLLVALFHRRLEGGPLPGSRLTFLLVALAIALSVSWLQSVLFLGSLTAFSTGKFLGFAYLIVFTAAATSVIRERALWNQAIDALTLSGAVAGAIGTVGWLFWRFGFPNPLVDGDRLTSTMWADPNIFAGLMAVTLILAIARTRFADSSSRWLWVACAAIILTALILSQSRSGSIAAIVGLAALAVWYRPSVVLAGIAALVVTGSLIWAIGIWVDLPVSGGAGIWNDKRFEGTTVESRTEYWRRGAALLPTESLSGIGVGVFEQTNLVKAGPGSADTFARAHNTYLTSVLELGVTGTLALAMLAGGVLGALREGLRGLDKTDRWMLSATACALVSVMVFAVAVDAMYQRHLWILIALILASPAAAAATRCQKGEPAPAQSNGREG